VDSKMLSSRIKNFKSNRKISTIFKCRFCEYYSLGMGYSLLFFSLVFIKVNIQKSFSISFTLKTFCFEWYQCWSYVSIFKTLTCEMSYFQNNIKNKLQMIWLSFLFIENTGFTFENDFDFIFWFLGAIWIDILFFIQKESGN
jgi:hypothetical protein